MIDSRHHLNSLKTWDITRDIIYLYITWNVQKKTCGISYNYHHIFKIFTLHSPSPGENQGSAPSLASRRCQRWRWANSTCRAQELWDFHGQIRLKLGPEFQDPKMLLYRIFGHIWGVGSPYLQFRFLKWPLRLGRKKPTGVEASSNLLDPKMIPIVSHCALYKRQSGVV